MAVKKDRWIVIDGKMLAERDSFGTYVSRIQIIGPKNEKTASELATKVCKRLNEDK